MHGTRRGGSTAAAAALAALALLASPARADAPPEGECDVRMDPRMSVYMVLVGDRPFQDKRYLTWDDAVGLRDVLVSAGACARAAGPKPCTLELIAAGNYAVMREGVNFDPYAKLRTLEAAKKYVRTLEKAKLCKPAG